MKVILVLGVHLPPRGILFAKDTRFTSSIEGTMKSALPNNHLISFQFHQQRVFSFVPYISYSVVEKLPSSGSSNCAKREDPFSLPVLKHEISIVLYPILKESLSLRWVFYELASQMGCLYKSLHSDE